MLRITINEEGQATRFKLEGKLAQEWVAEASLEWNKFAANSGVETAVVDLCGVLFVDEAGRDLLTQIVAAGAKLEGCGPMTNSLIEEVTATAKNSETKNQKTPGIAFVLLLLLAASAAYGYRAMDQVRSFLRFSPQAETQRVTKSPVQAGKATLER